MKEKERYRERNPSIEWYIHEQNITNAVTLGNNCVTNFGDINIQNYLERVGRSLKKRRRGGKTGRGTALTL